MGEKWLDPKMRIILHLLCDINNDDITTDFTNFWYRHIVENLDEF